MRDFLRTYFIPLIALLAIGVTVLAGTALEALSFPNGGEPRPTEAQLKAYTLRYRIASGAPVVTLTVGTDGTACHQALAKSARLSTACVLALNVDPAWIAGEAFGRLNSEDTVAFEAIIWRARLNGDPNACDRAGLLDQRLARCRSAATDKTYQVSDAGVTVIIPTPATAQPPSPSEHSLVPPAVADRTVLPSCGSERATSQHGPWNEAARICFWDAYRAHRPAEFASTQLTTEGDPITSIYRVLGAGLVEIFIDSTQDRFASDRGWQRLDCSTLATVHSLALAPDFGPDNTCVATPLH